MSGGNAGRAAAMVARYPSARAFLADARRAALRSRDLSRAISMLPEMGPDRDGPRPKGPHPDPTASLGAWRAQELPARSARWEAELASCEALVSAARALCRGIGMALGDDVGHALESRYADALPWAEVARMMGRGESTLYRWRDVACDWADSVGPWRAVSGRGNAGL